MVVTFTTAAKNAALDAVLGLADSGAGTEADIQFASGPAFGFIIGRIDCRAVASGGAFFSANDGSAGLAGTPREGTATSSGQINNFRLRDTDNQTVLSGTVTAPGGGGDITMADRDLITGEVMRIDDFSVNFDVASMPKNADGSSSVPRTSSGTAANVRVTSTGASVHSGATSSGQAIRSDAAARLIPGGGGAPSHSPTQVGSGPFVSLSVICPYFDVIPGQFIDSPTNVGVACHHSSGIDRVELSVNNGTPVVVNARALNPDTNVWEFYALLDPSDFGSDGSVTLSAIMYPVAGTTRQVVSNVYVSVTGSRTTRYVSPSGSDGASGTLASPFRTFERAARSIWAAQSGSADGGLILCASGSYTWKQADQQGGNAPADVAVTIRPDYANGADRDSVVIDAASGGGPRIGHIHLQDVTLRRNINLNGDSSLRPTLWLDKIHRHDGPQAYSIDNFQSGGFGGVYLTNSVFQAAHQGMSPRATFVRNTVIVGVYEDALRNCRMFLSCWVDDGDAREQCDWDNINEPPFNPSLMQPHCDALQVAATVQNWDHILWQDCRVTNFNGQGVYIHTNQKVWDPGGTTEEQNQGLIENVALVNISVHGRGGGAPDTFVSHMNETSHHFQYMVWGCTWHRQSADWQYLQDHAFVRGSIKGNVFHGISESSAPGHGGTPNLDADHNANRLIWETNHVVGGASSTPGGFTTGDPDWEANYYAGVNQETGYSVVGSVSGAGRDPTDGPQAIAVSGSGIFLRRGTPITFSNLPPTGSGLCDHETVREYVVWEDTPAGSGQIVIWPPIRSSQTVSGTIRYVSYRPRSGSTVLPDRVTGPFVEHEQQITRPFLEGNWQVARLRPSIASVGAFEEA